MQAPDTASRVLGGEAVLISPADNVVRMLNVPASSVWVLCDGNHTVEEIAAVLVHEFDVDLPTVLQDVSDFINQMVEKGLLSLER